MVIRAEGFDLRSPRCKESETCLMYFAEGPNAQYDPRSLPSLLLYKTECSTNVQSTRVDPRKKTECPRIAEFSPWCGEKTGRQRDQNVPESQSWSVTVKKKERLICPFRLQSQVL